MELLAVYTHQTKLHYIFQLYEKDRKVVGTLCYLKSVPIPEEERFAFVNPNHERWRPLVRELVERSRGKSRRRLERALRRNGNEDV